MDYGLIGGLLGYSYSKMIHEQLGLCSYENYVVTPDGLEDFIKKTNLKGFNVTAPQGKYNKISRRTVAFGEKDRLG